MTTATLVEQIKATTLVDTEHVSVWVDDDGRTLAAWAVGSGVHPQEYGFEPLDQPVLIGCDYRGIDVWAAEVVGITELVAWAAAWPRR